jgi:hypothetical protein
MKQLVVVGGGWAGCAAALTAAKKGMAVALVERTDRLLASGLVGGIMRNNGRFTAAEELVSMGGGELIDITDACSRHAKLDFPGHRHASLYDVDMVEALIQQALIRQGVKLLFLHRAVDVEVEENTVKAVRLNQEGLILEGAVFIDSTGTAGPIGNCSRYGNGCAMCIYRCPAFGPRVSMAVKAGAEELPIRRAEGLPGYFSGSCELEPSSLAGWLLEEIRAKGVVTIPLTGELRAAKVIEAIKAKACRQYSSAAFQDNLILLDTGAIKMMVPYLPLQLLRRLDGFERAIFRDPLGGSKGNSIRFSGLVRRDNRLMVPPLENLLVAGERAGLVLGHTEAIITGTLAGYNAWRLSRGDEPVELPRSTTGGQLIAYARQKARSAEGRRSLYTLAGGEFWEHLQRHRFYTTDREVIRRRVESAGALNLFA